MRLRDVVALCALCACVAVAAGCSFLGQSEVHLESGNQPSGFLTRPMTITTSSDASVQEVAQRICDGVKPGSLAQIAFVGKVPGPGPIEISDWGKYRYDCQAVAQTRATAATPPPAVTAPAAPAAQGTFAPAPPPALPLSDAQEQQRRECQRKQGTYQICLGSCLASSSSNSLVVEAECAQRCAPQLPGRCN